ncbi:MAG: reverse transcriptase domain-containing protein [Euryarchaeota archaeon]|nr:reverse transcriptase domain-containing protein [Euryarchaeota archaeon]
MRYADDFVVCFEKEVEARAFGDDLRRRMGEFGLTVSEEKSKTIKFGRRACTKARR